MDAVVSNKILIFLLIFIIFQIWDALLNYEIRKIMVLRELKKVYFSLFFNSVIKISSLGDFIFITLSVMSLGIVNERT